MQDYNQEDDERMVEIKYDIRIFLTRWFTDMFIAMSHTSLHGFKDRFCIVFDLAVLSINSRFVTYM